ncbi:GNAT family N-acetyltransferase [Glaciimonas sp. Gout2]|uniref:GNAT family N-acetyltransferase n=1 Tax=unclassified Glaciimonas TaxID=2644401 RepID=UPI002B230949|nr:MULTISPECIES: GNAT family N-acetyltransferase [unclassified Glaciimonas]MEB0014084.1 GNAT family N-acetyltransferase [Glaciimonas sp. Cout2]MEB0083416.1 GNAT family N-acetyltransferase [Glaciimonas sp. Gout2]
MSAADNPVIVKMPRPTIYVKELSRHARKRLLRHFLALDSGDRLLRFGSVLPDTLVTRYVEGLDFDRDTIFGVYDRKLRLLGAGHLAFAPREALPSMRAATTKERVAEFGVSVSTIARGMGVGTRLFERAAIHCRNADIDTLYVHCLSSNKVMMHIAKKAGMTIHRDYGEADAYLKLLPASPATVIQEAMQEQVATLDYTLKANVRAALKWLGNLPGFKRK